GVALAAQYRFLVSSRAWSAALPTAFCTLPAFFSMFPLTSLALWPVSLPAPSLMAPLTSCFVPSVRFLSTHGLRFWVAAVVRRIHLYPCARACGVNPSDRCRDVARVALLSRRLFATRTGPVRCV